MKYYILQNNNIKYIMKITGNFTKSKLKTFALEINKKFDNKYKLKDIVEYLESHFIKYSGVEISKDGNYYNIKHDNGSMCNVPSDNIIFLYNRGA